ncbi:glutathione synthase [Hydrogenovibrio thermophilus]|jgi:glutathione synthase|uniref:Glutathione synthetase n=1 Tax=Hydrogenovibrio thermophilus TaxID=265883 RepID=A0A410H463_9GAMM|nr:glutathione synthase [Hydrogenovibrio thermophilus]QAB15713.1 glutathione synthase [Hydrogenovibrio thermophilus]
MNIGFIFEDWDTITPAKNSTIRIIKECLERGHKVSILYPSNLTVRNNVTHGYVKRILPMEKIPDNILQFYKKVKFEQKMMPLHGLDAIMVRRDPPIDSMVYNFLDSVKNEVVIINDIDGIRKANNKLYTTTFNDPNNSFLPITHVSKNKEYIRQMIDEMPGDKVILKPLNASGGHGVIVLEKNAQTSINSILDFYIHTQDKSYVIVQEYIEGAEEGDVRVLMLNGKFIGAYNRKPPEGDVRANIQVGGTAHKYKMTESQMAICRKIGPKLAADGLYFVGVDMIGDKILEVNVLNPGGITNINALNKLKLHKNVVDFIEEKVHEKEEKRAELEFLLKRLSEFRQSDTNE